MALFYPVNPITPRLEIFFNDNWNSIWNHPLCISLRERQYIPEKCSRLFASPRMWRRMPSSIRKYINSIDTGINECNSKNSFKNLLAPIKPLQAGMYHYISPQDDPRNYRLHLRIEKDGNGILILNGSTILHLNQTATEYAYYLIQKSGSKKSVIRWHPGIKSDPCRSK